MYTHLKIGIIQNAALTADLPNNLRQIVQGYRECLDHGANLIIASAYSLCGANPQALSNRQSFLTQTQAALESLSQELGDTPLILAAYAPLFEEYDYDLDEPQLIGPAVGVLTPYLLEQGEITQLEEMEAIDICDTTICVNINDTFTEPDDNEVELIIQLSETPWHAGAVSAEDEHFAWVAQENNAVVVCTHHVGAADDNIHAGGSAVYNQDGSAMARLPFFESANRVISLKSKTRAKAAPAEEELLCLALQRGIRDTVRNNGYSGVSLNLDAPNADLLAALSIEALGRSNVVGMSSSQEANHIANALKITSISRPLNELIAQATQYLGEDSDELLPRLNALLQYTAAEKRGLMHLSSLTRSEIMTGSFTLYGESCGLFAPLGNLYEMDIHLLRQLLSEKYADLFGTLKEPDDYETDRIIHEIADRNIGATALLQEHTFPLNENKVRMVQRKIIASALKRTQLPMILRVDRPEERISLPVAHRLND
ncbi:MAG: hypothetical protein IKZ07_04380 [Akkermansia sp.]|nr:hypothetical protein [Akkermansia sp.]